MYKVFIKNIPNLFFYKEEPMVNGARGIYIGPMKYSRKPFFWDLNELINQHIVVVGITGSGKSYFIKSFLTRAMLAEHANAIIIDWTGEYKEWVEKANGKTYDIEKTGFNVMAKQGIKKEDRVKIALSSFDVLLGLKNFPDERVEIEEALSKEFSKKNPSLKGLLKRVKGNSSKILKGLLIKGGKTIEEGIGIDDIYMKGLISVDLSGLASDEIKSLIGLTVLQLIKERMRREKIEEKKGVKMFVVLDEAWKIAKEESDVVVMFREGRKYNFSIIIASQNPTDVSETIFSNAGTTFIFRTMLKEYRRYVGDTLSLDDESIEQMASLGVGECMVNLALAKAGNKNFIINRVQGEDFIFRYKVGDLMEFDKDRLIRALLSFGLSNSDVVVLKEEFNKNNGDIEGIRFIEILQEKGMDRRRIFSMLRHLGIDEEDIIELFNQSKKGFAEVEIDED